MKKKFCGARIMPVCLLAMLLMLLMAGKTMAASPVKIVSCRMSSASKLQVIASCEPEAVAGDTCYLFSLPFSGGKINTKAKPLASAPKAATMTFHVKVKKAARQSLLYCRYAVAEKSAGGYRSVSSAVYVTNPGAVAKYRYSFPAAASKKGLQVSASMLEDADELHVQHSVLNIILSDLIAVGAQQNAQASIPYQYNGKTYWMTKSCVAAYDRQLKSLKANGTVISAVLLLGYRKGNTYLIHSKARKAGYAYYAWNLADEKARETFQAALSFLAGRYCTKAAKNGRIANWIVGNEVESPSNWNYSGGMSLSAYVANYTREFRLTYTAVTSVYANARVYISLSHLWNTKTAGNFTSREVLEAFAAAISAQGYIPWNLAYHPYSSPLTEPKFWENKNRQLTAALTTPVINMGNLSVLTEYIRSHYGASTRIILSEAGFTSVKSGKNVQKEQAAAIAYSYLLTEADDMVDSFIMNRHVDNTYETVQGLNLGLWTTSRTEWANKKKRAWTVFKYMDTNLSETVTSQALSVIGIKAWADVIADYSPGMYAKFNILSGNLQVVGSYRKTRSITKKWKLYGAGDRMTKKKNVFTVTHKEGRNAHSQWGFVQTFSKRLNLKAAQSFCTTLEVTGSQKKNVLVKIRFYAGKNVFECQQVIPRGRKVKLRADLSAWEARESISRIQIALEPVSGGWKQGAQLKMTRPVAGA